ncbi:uroporphyrinogen-III synthase [Paenibacillus xylanexedens]|uniref:uroporphyrinogen-III synthase n=1 Tax=Paenibacillus xylanexedens TaxID=528191 RepID=UPI0009386A15|nr:uroporphyrinogen-III synthase [Paenibacillus xylanexedens]APO42749.1 uroporphyrinogen-III synthase [Paenibacillus xylanexedens]
MAQHLAGVRVALTGPRKSKEMSILVEKMGGIPLVRPAQGTVFLDDRSIRDGLVSWISDPPDWTVLTTGMGLDALFEMAEDMEVAGQLLDVLSESSIAARGYKTVNALKKRKLTPLVRDDDGSTDGLIREFAPHDLAGKKVMLQLHGETAPKLVAWLEEQGAIVRQVLPYRHVPPEEEELEQLLNEILNFEVDAVAFTSGPQVRFLTQYAASQDKLEPMLAAFRQGVIPASVGKVTANSMREEGIEALVIPEEEKMGALIVELGRYFAAGHAAKIRD